MRLRWLLALLPALLSSHHALAQAGYPDRPIKMIVPLAAASAVDVAARIVTQNVDGLHQRAGSASVVELHGSIDAVICLECGARHTRAAIQAQLLVDNPALADVSAAVSADGDAHLEWDALDAFRVPVCPACGGMLKPDVVFFGENVPRPRVDRCFQAVEEAAALLVLGSSLTVLSGFRFVRHAARRATPIAIVNQGATRGDDLATVRVDGALGEVLSALAD